MAKKTLSLFTKTLLSLLTHKAGNGYPKCPLHESRRIPTDDLKQMEQVDYDHIGNNYEIYRTERKSPKYGDHYIHYNYRGREVTRFYPPEERIRKRPKKGETIVEGDTHIKEYPRWVEVKTHWSQEDINEYIDSLTPDIIKKTTYWYNLPVDEIEVPSIVQLIKESVDTISKYSRKCDRGDYQKGRELATEIKPIYEHLLTLLPQIEDKDATLVRTIVADLDRIDWPYALSSGLDQEGIRKPMNELRYCDTLRLKEVKHEYKKRLYASRISDGEPIAQAMGYDILHSIKESLD